MAYIFNTIWTDKESADAVRRNQRNILESRRLTNDLEAKRRDRKYQDLLAVRENLPAFQMREHIVKTIFENRVVVVSGDTGCGKTTQIPQLVFDAAIDSGKGAEINLVVTQPRRISAISVAERIAQERVETVGQTAGYHIKLESKKSGKTRVLLMTTGVLLRRLQMEGDLRGISHVFVGKG
jgi:ATP-dependent RNA helicase DHX36